MKSVSRKFLEKVEKTLSRVHNRPVNERKKINEKYPAEFRGVKNLREISYYLTDKGIDIEHSVFDVLPIKNGRDKRLKEAGYVIVIGESDQYVPVKKMAGLAEITYDGRRVNVIDAEFSGGIKFKYASWRELIATGKEIYYIPVTASNSDLRAARAEAKSGDINLDRDKHKQWRYTSINGRNGHTWLKYHGYDKSGYKLDPNKYRNMLTKIKSTNDNWKKDAEAALSEYESYLDIMKESARMVSTGKASRFLGKYGSNELRNFSSEVSYLGEAIENIFSVAKSLDDVKNTKDPMELEQKEHYREILLQRAIKNLKNCRDDARKALERFNADKNS